MFVGWVCLFVLTASLLLESYLRGCGSHRKELRDQVKAMDLLVDVAVKIK